MTIFFLKKNCTYNYFYLLIYIYYFIIIGKIIENLAAIGYDSNNMYLASYDWRLAFYNLEIRDKYFTKLKAMIETLKMTEGKKTVLLTHSMGMYNKIGINDNNNNNSLK